jgi:hypothetical protein
MVLRSDEAANQEQVKRDERFRGNVGKGVAAAASLGTAAVFGPMAARVMPFLNQYIPAALAMKGINKVSPKLGSFLQKGQEMGLDLSEGLNFIKEKLGGDKSSESPKENKNIIEQYEPELHTYIKMKLGEGMNLMQAGKKALDHSRFKSAVEKLTKDHKTSWDAILKTVYGHSEKAQPSPQQQTQQTQQPQPEQAQPGQGQAALMAILQKLQQSRSGK